MEKQNLNELVEKLLPRLEERFPVELSSQNLLGVVALLHAGLGEVTNLILQGHELDDVVWIAADGGEADEASGGVPYSPAVELAQVALLILAYLAKMGIDPERALELAKMGVDSQLRAEPLLEVVETEEKAP